MIDTVFTDDSRRRPPPKERIMTWETPAYQEIRLGFEVTAYVYVR
ncbi:pyrroloquinoline quinone precursor peptide PqqA [Cognatazoarcus halotolerans]|nr:pyrroloquinoline quinone precursor peptide PqqA [Cognatazoarcus halotolerans]MCB1900521.1 pyrroloquinoline quinone precursor peptide PqqA [Rhodocyclaceae bacterium]